MVDTDTNTNGVPRYEKLYNLGFTKEEKLREYEEIK